MKYTNADELSAEINTDLCCKNCLYRKENSLYCYKINREINLNQCCQYLVYRLRHDIQDWAYFPKGPTKGETNEN